jgi:hypothetical protein
MPKILEEKADENAGTPNQKERFSDFLFHGKYEPYPAYIDIRAMYPGKSIKHRVIRWLARKIEESMYGREIPP